MSPRANSVRELALRALAFLMGSARAQHVQEGDEAPMALRSSRRLAAFDQNRHLCKKKLPLSEDCRASASSPANPPNIRIVLLSDSVCRCGHSRYRCSAHQ
eukprot:7350813-Alexandrium_andersonii.AAC.1